MDVQAATIRTVYVDDGKRAAIALVFPMCITAIALGAAAAGLLLFRRLSGAIALPVSEPVLAWTGLVMAGYVVVLRLSWFTLVRDDPHGARPFSPLECCLITTVTLSVVAVAASLSIPGTETVGLLLLWSLPLGMELAMAVWANRMSSHWGLRFGGHTRPNIGPRVPGRPSGSTDEPPEEIPADDHSFRFDPPHQPSPPHWPDDDVSQQLTRRRTAEGVDSMHLWVRGEVLSGARVGAVHLAFCPPFGHTPEVLFEQADGPEATIKPGQVLPYGVRLEWKLASVATSDQSVLIEVFVQDARTVVASR